MADSESSVTGTIVDYDPGGNGRHGLACLRVEGGTPKELRTQTALCVDDVVRAIDEVGDVVRLGVHTLTCWGTGKSGWRPADRWLIRTYLAAKASVVSPNSLYGSISIGGMSVVVFVRDRHPTLTVSESTPRSCTSASRETGTTTRAPRLR